MIMRTIASVIAVAALTLAGPSVAQSASEQLRPLVSADWLHDNLDREDLVVLDIRNRIDGGDRDTYESGHIPGAVYSSYTDDGWRVSRGDVPGMLPDVEDLEGLIGGLGIDNDTTVVVVPAGTGPTDFGSATRVYWTLKVVGHDRVTILNGGHKGWTEAGYEVATGWNEPDSATFNGDLQAQLIADAEAVERARDNGVALVDNRPPKQFAGEAKHPAARAAGTIPDASSLPHSKLVSDGTAYMFDRDELERVLDEAAYKRDERVVTFCNTGHWASMGWFALSEVMGHKDVAMYDGSMTHWTQDESRPLQTASQGLGRFVDWLFN